MYTLLFETPNGSLWWQKWATKLFFSNVSFYSLPHLITTGTVLFAWLNRWYVYIEYKYSLWDKFVYIIHIRILNTMKIKWIKSQTFIECIYYIWRCLHFPLLSHNSSGIKYKSVCLSHSFLCGEIIHTYGYFNGKFNWQNRLRSTRQGSVITYDNVIIYPCLTSKAGSTHP